ncbi:MAG: hypothetical protein LBN93_01835 [Candidatus Symbiothrix sp.]|jgi:hypothetical protein|nr:hypothetical protein [Candidatus Symbiothrix sp.]
MIKRNLELLLFIIALITATDAIVTAQVSIGTPSDPPLQGVKLELDGTKGGLLLSQVEITDLTALPVDFPTETDPDTIVGLLVYNKTAAVDEATSTDIPIGVYYWSSTGWKLLG